jgi:hypothetical protein
LTCHRAFCRHVVEQPDKNVESFGAIEQELHVGASCERRVALNAKWCGSC